MPGIVYVVNSLVPGGTERLVVEMSEAFNAEHEPCVMCLDEPGLWAVGLRNQGIPVYCAWREPGLDVSVPGRIAAVVRRHNADIIHAHQYSSWFYGALSRLYCRAPRLLFEEHGRFYPEADKPLRRLVNRVLIARLTDRIVAVSEDIRQRLVRYEGLNPRRIDVVYNGIHSPERISPELRSRLRTELGFAADEFVVGTVGRLDPIKNLPMLVDSIADVAATHSKVRGLIVGGGAEFGEIAARAASLDIGNRIHMTGFRDDARELVQCLDLFVLSSYSEGTSIALLEAMATGVPVAVTDVGGNPEVVLDKTTGRVLPCGDVASLSQAIVEALDQPELRARRAAAASVRYSENFSFDGMIRQYRDIYDEMLGV